MCRISVQDVGYSLRVFEKAVAGGSAEKLDLAFFGILNADIEQLQEQKGARFLARKLEEIAIRICNAHQKIGFESHRQVVEGPFSMEAFLEKRDPEPAVRKGLELLKNRFQIRKVIGDGHCLFRGVGTAFLAHFCEMAEQERYLERLQALVASLQCKSLTEKFKKIEEILQYLSADKIGLWAVSHDAVASDELVGFLRELACEYNVQHNEKFRAKVEGFYDASLAHYVKEMKTTTKWGGPLETQALAEVLQVDVRVFDVERFALKGDDSVNTYRAKNSVGEIDLIFTKNHYDIGLRKSAS